MISHASLLKLLVALIAVESGGNPRAYNPQEKAVGLLQIRPCVIDDVNRITGSRWRIEDAYDPAISQKIAIDYLTYWTAKSEQSSLKSAARIWNGGPDGWWELSTLKYWVKVRAKLQDIETQERYEAHLRQLFQIPSSTPVYTIRFQKNPASRFVIP